MSSSRQSCLAVICFIVLSVLSEEWVHSQQQHHHVISIRSLMAGTNCTSPLSSYNPAAAAPGTLQVVHRSCSPAAGKHESASDHVALLHRDKFRVETIHRQHLAGSGSATTTATATATAAADSQTRLGLPFRSLEYVVTIGIGSPERVLTVVLDTGSDLTWVQCEPCSSCYTQEEPLFDPRESTTYENVECTDQDCFMSSGATTTCGVGAACVYEAHYGDRSFSSGYLARESITLSPKSTSSDTLAGVLFGCAALRNGGFRGSRVPGILGLGQGASSLVSQTSAVYDGAFSYCLRPRGSAAGYLAFGTAPPQPDNIRFTPLVSNANPSYYSVELTGIEVAGRSLPVAPSAFAAGTIVDSGTVVTRLPPDAYAALRAEFRRRMGGRYPAAPALGRVLDTCYDVTGHDEVDVPGVALLFGGGARLDVDASGILLVADVSQACLAFAPNADPRGLSIIGNMQQRTHAMVFDVAGGRVGFGANGCN